MNENPFSLIPLLLARLERISADSVWAHRASGIRGSLFKVLEKLENGENVSNQILVDLYQTGFYILEQAARIKQ